MWLFFQLADEHARPWQPTSKSSTLKEQEEAVARLGGDRLVKFLHWYFAEPAKVLRPAARVAGFTILARPKVGTPFRTFC
jgi:hypothetical protein